MTVNLNQLNAAEKASRKVGIFPRADVEKLIRTLGESVKQSKRFAKQYELDGRKELAEQERKRAKREQEEIDFWKDRLTW